MKLIMKLLMKLIMQPSRHRFFVLNYLARHNKCVAEGDVPHLSPMIRTQRKRKATAYTR